MYHQFDIFLKEVKTRKEHFFLCNLVAMIKIGRTAEHKFIAHPHFPVRLYIFDVNNYECKKKTDSTQRVLQILLKCVSQLIKDQKRMSTLQNIVPNYL